MQKFIFRQKRVFNRTGRRFHPNSGEHFQSFTAPLDLSWMSVVRMAFTNGKVGKTQRLAAVEIVDQLPRSAIGKVLKRELRDRYVAAGKGAPG